MKAYEELEIFPALVPIESAEGDSKQQVSEAQAGESKSEPTGSVTSADSSTAEASKSAEKQDASENKLDAAATAPTVATAGGLGAGASVPPGMTLRQGLSTIGSLVVDYRGSRVAVQAVMPGILEKPQDEQLKYAAPCVHLCKLEMRLLD